MTAPRNKQFSATVKALSAPDEATLREIRNFTLVDVEPEQLVVREFVLAHNCIDRDGECFDEALLARFAETIPGKGCFIKHPMSWDGDSGPAEGLVFHAHIETMPLDQARTVLREPNLTLPPDRSEAHLLVTRAYFVRTPDNGGLLLKMDAGIAGYVSIGFTTENAPVKVFDGEGRELDLRRWQLPGGALEQSLVWLGAQPGARATKGAHQTEEAEMTLQEQLDAEKAKTATLTTEVTSLKTAVADGKAAADSHAALKTALGDDAPLLDAPAKVVALVSAGKAYRKGLIDQLVLADREAKRCGDDDAAVKAATDEYDELPTKALERMASAEAGEGAGAKTFGIQGGDPAVTKGAPDPAKGPFGHNPAFGAVAAAG